MLHILLLILKWIGIVLAVFLLLVLLLINLGLFVPVRYRADASCQNDIETLEAEFELSWMWKLFFLTACWKKGKADMKIRIGWKYLFSEEKEEQKFLKEQKESLPPEKTNRSLLENNVQEQAEKRECHQEKTESGIDKEEEEKESFTADRRKAGGRKKKPLWDRMKEKISEWIESCKSFWRKILAMGRNFRGKKEQIESFLTDASHRRAFCSLKREVRRFLGHVSPKDVKIVGKIGLEDPYMTGQALAVLGMLFPFLGENTVIVPDFENKVLEGSVHIEGKIHNFRMLAILWRLIKDRDVRKIIIDIKKLKW
ncbi:DUF2953 domain-containing protein [Coprococcus sp. AF18-48]|nr:DUF2953 domain-containing protein [Coprococcus sp. AF18-48]